MNLEEVKELAVNCEVVFVEEQYLYKSLIKIGTIRVAQKTRGPILKQVIKCSECCKDSELYGDGLFIISANHLNMQILPCGCGNYRPTKEQYKIKIKRVLSDGPLEFVDFKYPYTKGSTKCIISCPTHGLWDTASINYLINRKLTGCPQCAYDTLGDNTRKNDEEMIREFREVGGHGDRVLFNRSERKNKSGKKIYWNMTCDVCGITSEITGTDIKRGSKPCICGRNRQTLAYIMLVKDGLNYLGLKFGITYNLEKRLKELNKNNNLSIELFSAWQFSDTKSCRAAEKECLSSLDCGIFSSQELSYGSTETTSIGNLDAIVKIYEKHGGNMLTS